MHGSMLAEGRLEYLAAQPFDQVQAMATQNFSSPYQGYQYAVHVDYVSGPMSLNIVSGATTNYKRATIVVLPPDTGRYELVTLMTEHGYD